MTSWFWSTLVVLTLLPAVAQGQIYFNERYSNNGSQTTSGFSNLTVTDSGFVACGQSAGFPFVGRMALTLRFLDELGQQTRVKHFGDSATSYLPAFFNGFLKVPGGFVMPGSAFTLARENIGKLWRFDPQGDTLWTRTYRSAEGIVLNSACRTQDGGYALVGTIVINQAFDYLLIRTDSLGNALWQRSYSIGYDDYSLSIAPTPDGGFLLGGFTHYQAGNPSQDAYLVKTDSVGNLLWQRTYTSRAGGGQDAVGSVMTLRDGNYLAAGVIEKTVINSEVQQRNILYKLNPQGQLLWQREIGPQRNSVAPVAVHELADGSLVVAGQQGDPVGATPVGNGFPEGFIYKVCADGDSVWYRAFKKLTGGQSHNYVRDLRPTADGGFVGCGFLFTRAPDVGSSDAWVFRMDSAGYLQAGGAPPTVVCTPVGLPNDSDDTAGDNAAAGHLNVWPNPAPDGRYTVHLPATTGPATLTLLDALGRTLWRGVARTNQPTPLDLSRHPPGVYLLRTQTAHGRTFTNRLIR